MMTITADEIHFRELNNQIRNSVEREILVKRCLGQRYIGNGLSGKRIRISGTPGNALGAYLNGAELVVDGNAQDATGDTMNEGRIVIHGSSGDATGYAMRGGRIYVKGDAGYRAGIHMKAYQGKLPVLVIGGNAGSFLGEYQAGGLILVLGLGNRTKEAPVGYFCGTGMHGGKIYLRCKEVPKDLPKQVCATKAGEKDLREIEPYLEEFCQEFGENKEAVCSGCFYVLTPNSGTPYQRLYTENSR